MVQVPKFSLNKAKIKTQEELDAKEAASKTGGSKYLREGLHDVTIVGATYEGPASDDNWGKFLLKFKGLQDRESSAMLIVPLADIEYRTRSGGTTTFMYTKFRRFMDALGVKVTVENLEDTLKEYFTNVGETLVGRMVNIKIAYSKTHVKYLGKDEAGLVKYGIAMTDGSLLASAAGKPLTFSDFDSAAAHAEANQIELQDYPSVQDYVAVAGGIPKKVSNW